jgi:hypothetical protein
MHRTQNPTASAADTDDRSVVTPATILRGAALYLTRHGWIQNDYYADITQPFPAACVTGAIAMAAYGRTTPYPSHTNAPGVRDYRRAVDVLTDYLDCEAHGPYDPDSDIVLPFSWNDATDRTAEQVISTLHAAAEQYDRETYAQNELDHDRIPTTAGFLAWVGAR